MKYVTLGIIKNPQSGILSLANLSITQMEVQAIKPEIEKLKTLKLVAIAILR